MQSFVQPLLARSSSAPFTAPALRSATGDRTALVTAPTGAAPVTPFLAANLFMSYKQHTSLKAAYVAFLINGQLIAVEWLHGQRGHNPPVNVLRVIRRAKQLGANQILLATWVRTTSEPPYALEFIDEVIAQHSKLARNRLTLIDSLRLSETGAYSYYGDHKGPYANSPTYHERSLSRYYPYGF